MKKHAIFLCLFIIGTLSAQKVDINYFKPNFDNSRITYIDLDHDGDPDLLCTYINDSIPCQWIDDDEDMKNGDLQGDMDNDCLMIDRNNDGKYGDELDLIIDWNDTNGDGKDDMQIIADNAKRTDRGWTPGHFMISLDTDHDQVMNYIDWNTLQIEAWDKIGSCNFFQDYSGKSMLMKIHTSSFNIEDLRYNWENPFLFYDADNDGLTEMAIRLVDAPKIDFTKQYPVALSHKITDVRLSIDLDNDNGVGNEFDYDLSLKFTGKGFDYSSNIHKFKNMRGLPQSDQFFYDPRWRQMDELIYVDHQNAYRMLMKQGDWSQCWLTFDEDDDCQRWERVEFYEPKKLWEIGARNDGLDNNPQADVAGDRGEWDLDNSGKGKLYIGKFDGMIHLFGAETGAWRIDQNAQYFQGWQGWRGGADTIKHNNNTIEPITVPIVKYADTDKNGFIDLIEYDLNGDKKIEKTISLIALGIDDKCEILETAEMNYKNYHAMFAKVSNEMWQKAEKALKIARKYNINTQWYACFLAPKNAQQKYHNGYWLNFFIYTDLRKIGMKNNNQKFMQNVDIAYFSGNWDSLIRD